MNQIPLSQQETYWLTQLGDSLPQFDSLLNHRRPPVQSYIRNIETTLLNLHHLQAACTLEDASQFGVLLAIFSAMLQRHTAQDDIIIGAFSADSRCKGSGQTFVNLIPLRLNLVDDPTGAALLRLVELTLIEAAENKDYPFEELVGRLANSSNFERAPVFQIMLIPLNQPSPLSETPITSAHLNSAQAEIARCDLVFTIDEYGQLTCNYDTDLFNPQHINRMFDHLKMLLTGLANQPDTPISMLPILAEDERHQLLIEWNETAVDFPGQDPIQLIIQTQAGQYPETVAVTFENARLTYRQLNERANRLAHYLQTQGVGPDVPVGVAMERSLEMVIALLGVLKAGGAYVPIDPTYPAERVAFMLSDSQVPVLLTQQQLLARLPQHQAHILCLDSDWSTVAQHRPNNPVPNINLDNLAYIIYTSGSTGRPKGAMNTHRGIRNRLLWMQDAYHLKTADRVLQKTPFSFDVSVWEFFWPLMFGARLVVARPGGHQDSNYLVNTIAHQRITTLHFVPSMLQVFLEGRNLEHCSHLRQVICSGEALSLELQNRFFAQLPEVNLHNLYGPTEAAIDVTFWQCDPHTTLETVPIGRPVANTQTYILDKHLQPVPIGAPGELHLGGVQLGRGYLNRPRLTAEKFIPNPFVEVQSRANAEPGVLNSKLYKTGDLARYLPDGNIEYLGRLDFQVKIRGFRIEVGEIERLLDQHTGVRASLVTVRQDTGDKRLVAYVLPDQPEPAGLPAQLHQYLQTRLPDYMLPTAYVFLDAFPLTPNGKINRQALPAPIDGDRAGPIAADYVSPRTPSERQLTQIWADLLAIEQVGVNDNFFALGGHSLLAARLSNRLRNTFQIEFTLEMLLEQSLAELAQYIDTVRWVTQPLPEASPGEYEEGIL